MREGDMNVMSCSFHSMDCDLLMSELACSLTSLLLPFCRFTRRQDHALSTI